MAKPKRYFRSGETYYISLQAQKGSQSFFDDACYAHYVTRLINCLGVYQVQLHTFALLPDQIHLLMTPSTPTGISNLMRVVGAAYAHYFNTRFDRKSTLWRGRFNSCLVPGGWHVLECQKYIELASVRARIVKCPGQYQWSSYCINAFGGHGGRVTMHDQYKEFGSKTGCRYQRYRDFVTNPYNPEQLKLLEHRLRHGYPRGKESRRVSAVRIARKYSNSVLTLRS